MFGEGYHFGCSMPIASIIIFFYIVYGSIQLYSAFTAGPLPPTVECKCRKGLRVISYQVTQKVKADFEPSHTSETLMAFTLCYKPPCVLRYHRIQIYLKFFENGNTTLSEMIGLTEFLETSWYQINTVEVRGLTQENKVKNWTIDKDVQAYLSNRHVVLILRVLVLNDMVKAIRISCTIISCMVWTEELNESKPLSRCRK